MADTSKIAQQMKADWDRRVKHDYRFWMSDGHQDDAKMWESGGRDLSIITEGISTPERKTLLDLGCGVGRLLKAALPIYGRVIGVDVSSAAIEKARQLLGQSDKLTLQAGNGLDLQPLADKSVDVVISFAALVSMPTEVVAGYFREIYRVLRPGGIARLQFYLGKEQLVTRESTLHLRGYERENFLRALETAGFDVEWVRELVLPFQVSFKEVGLEAHIASIIRSERVPAPAEIIARTMLPAGEAEKSNDNPDENLEYWVAVNYAKELAERGDLDKARETLAFAETLAKTATIDVSDVLGRIVQRFDEKRPPSAAATEQGGTVFEANLKLIEKRFPELAARFRAYVPGGLAEVRDTAEGPSIFTRGQCQDHPTKPKGGAQAWVSRLLQEERLRSAKQLCVCGFGGGYHLAELAKQTPASLAAVEPVADTFALALRTVDFSPWFDRITDLKVGAGQNPSCLDQAELLVRPQVQAIEPEFCAKLKSAFYGARGLSLLHPKIGIVGPLQGGTLPITAYTTRAFQMLQQRHREFDVSGFAPGYHEVAKFLFDKYRQTAVQNIYLEMVSQILFEAINEKPVDILICMAQAPISGRVLTELRKRGTITVLWFVEDYLRFTYWKELARYFDFVFTIQRGPCLDMIREAGAGEVHYLPVACDPGVHGPVELTEEERRRWGSPISFVGAGYHNRQQVFASFADMPFKIWGTEWPECRPFDRMLQEGGRRIKPAEYVKIFNSTDVNINLHSSTERDGVEPNGDFVNPRTFELAAAGAFQLCDERTLLPELFTPGEEIATFSDPDDLKRKIAYYLERPDERRRIAAKGRERALREHTYGHRIKDMLSVIYNSRFEQLKRRQDASPWNRMLERSKPYDELHQRLKASNERGEEPVLDGILADVMSASGKLSETEQKLLFLYHVRKQIIRYKEEEKEGEKAQELAQKGARDR